MIIAFLLLAVAGYVVIQVLAGVMAFFAVRRQKRLYPEIWADSSDEVTSPQLAPRPSRRVRRDLRRLERFRRYH